MTPEEIKALISSSVAAQMSEGLKSGLDEFRSFFESQLLEQLKPLAEKMTSFEDALTAPEGQDQDGNPLEATEETPDNTDPQTETMPDATTKALLERLQRMEAKEQEREIVAFQSL